MVRRTHNDYSIGYSNHFVYREILLGFLRNYQYWLRNCNWIKA